MHQREIYGTDVLMRQRLAGAGGPQRIPDESGMRYECAGQVSE